MPPPTNLYHGTSSIKLDSILAEGIAGPSYWGDEFLAQEFAEERASVLGGDPIVFAVALRRFDPSLLEPNDNGEGVAAIADENAAQVLNTNGGTWRESFEITGSVVYRGSLFVTEHDLLAKPEDADEPDPYAFR